MSGKAGGSDRDANLAAQDRDDSATPSPEDVTYEEWCAAYVPLADRRKEPAAATTERRGPHEVGKPCPRKPHMTVSTLDFERGKCGACGYGLLSLDAYMDRGGR